MPIYEDIKKINEREPEVGMEVVFKCVEVHILADRHWDWVVGHGTWRCQAC